MSRLGATETASLGFVTSTWKSGVKAHRSRSRCRTPSWDRPKTLLNPRPRITAYFAEPDEQAAPFLTALGHVVLAQQVLRTAFASNWRNCFSLPTRTRME